MHEYLDHELKEENNEEFNRMVQEAKAKYVLPEPAVSKRRRSSQVPTRADAYEYEDAYDDKAYHSEENPKKPETPKLTDDDGEIPEIHD